MKGLVGRALREPLLHFLVAGGILFAILSGGAEDPAATPPSNRIEVTDQDVERLSLRFQATWRRAPTARERARLIDDYVREKIFVREALALGLDQGDPVVRNRMRQKMAFLSQAIAQPEEPDDAELTAFLEQNAARYATPELIAFEHVYLGDNPDPEAVETVRAALRSGAASGSVGTQTLLPPTMPPSPPQTIDGVFGRGFAAAIAGLPADEWSGPVSSGYGLHLVRVTAQTAPMVPALAHVRSSQ